MTRAIPLGLFVDWLANGERGLSSEAIVAAITECKVGSRYNTPSLDYPRDPSDLRRCVALLDQHPWARNHLDRVAALSPQWAALIDHWDELEDMLRDEMRTGGKAPHTYHRMWELIKGADDE